MPLEGSSAGWGPSVIESNGSIPLVSFWPLLSGPSSGMGAYFRGIQGDGKSIRFRELNYRAGRGMALPAVLRTLEHQILAPIRNGRILGDIVGRSWILGGQQFVSHFSRRWLQTSTVVVFDLIDILCPDRPQTHRGIQAAWKSITNIREARAVVTISEYSRQRILGIYAMDPDRVMVIPFGVDSNRFRPCDEEERKVCRRSFGLSDTSVVVLYVGSEQRRKNLPTLIAGLGEYRRREPRVVFVKAGRAQSDAGRQSFLAALRANEMEQATILMEELTDEQIARLYRAADVFAFPSVEEGWGVPVLEAMASGVPVLSSRIGPVVEFAGDAVLYVDDPYSPGNWNSGLDRLLGDRQLTRRMTDSGRRIALELSWERARNRFTASLRPAQPN